MSEVRFLTLAQMKTFFQLSTKSRKRHMRLLAMVQKYGEHSFRGEDSFRMIERLHKAGIVTACASKWNWTGKGRRPFRELTVFTDETEARRRYPWTVLPRGFK